VPGQSGGFGPADRIRKSSDFRRVTGEGYRRAGSHVILLRARRVDSPADSLPPSRLGVTVSRKVGGAVVRNLVKRRLREWFRQARHELPGATDWVVIARKSAASVSFATLVMDLDLASGRREVQRG